MISDSKKQSKAIIAYYAALERLINQEKRISFDAVALEAGRGRGAIKGNTIEITQLKNAITLAKEEQEKKLKRRDPQNKLAELNRVKDNYKVKYKELLKINASLMEQLASTIFELAELKLEIKKNSSSNSNIIKIRDLK
ncbi:MULTISPECIES: hypothetical protein [Acinetobacter calcoaceticus/baumannii complex]|uniref:hypothetical protein n=1 Tax=Acinetobacter calcoaceticus/baumannii complex TaxID=909768 RepID=UPI002DB79EC7|nr:hypothetical protein [Acinetobacter pittii]MEB6625376.1 hypothetical protein [Acinetobacter pittii]